MKRAKSVAFFVVATCSLFLAMVAGTATATYPGYSVTVYGATTDPTLDGKWTTSTEWDDGAIATPHANDSYFTIKYTFVFQDPNFYVYDCYIVEFFSDNTNNTGDYVSVCYDCTANGGTAPQTDDIRIDYVGHNGTVITYKGTGAVWAPASLIDVSVAQSLDVSKYWSSPHWITEFRIEKTQNGPGMDNAIRVAVYDASNPSAGVKAWPPVSENVPNDFGADPANTTEPISEGVSLGAIFTISSVAVLVGSFCFRKRLRIGKLVAMP